MKILIEIGLDYFGVEVARKYQTNSGILIEGDEPDVWQWLKP